MFQRIMMLVLLSGMPLALGACGGCGGDNNTTTNNTTTADMDNTGGDMDGQCTPGEVGCACTMEGTCGGDAACVEGMCQGAQSSGLSVEAEAARSCEIMLEEKDGGRVLGATYADGVKGSWRRRAPNVALAITVSEDAAFPAGAVSVQFADGGTLPTVGNVKCFDASGEVIDGASATLK